MADAALAMNASQLSTVIRKMRDDVSRKAPALAEDLNLEERARRFFAHYWETFEALQAKGALHPELGRTEDRWDAWNEGAQFATEWARSNPGPLAPGDYWSFVRQLHVRTVGASAGRGFMSPELLGLTHIDTGSSLMGLPLLHYSPASATRRLAEIDAWLVAHDGASPPEDIASRAYLDYVEVHPFHDGNGRTWRLGSDALLERHGIEAPFWEQEQPVKKLPDGPVDPIAWKNELLNGIRRHLFVVERYWRVAHGAPSTGTDS